MCRCSQQIDAQFEVSKYVSTLRVVLLIFNGRAQLFCFVTNVVVLSSEISTRKYFKYGVIVLCGIQLWKMKSND